MWNPYAENCYQEWIVQYWVHGACSVCEDDPADNKGTCGLPTHRTAFNIEAETIWTPFRRRHFHVHFRQWKLWYFDWIFTEICSQGPIDNNPALVQIMAWRRSGDKPLSEPMMVTLPTHICVARPQWVNGCVTWFETWFEWTGIYRNWRSFTMVFTGVLVPFWC